jgi:hypothetical protein
VVIISKRFCGPPDSANGGYTAGLLGRRLSGAAEVTLRSPPPLEHPLLLSNEGGRVELKDADKLVAEARAAALDIALPAAVSFERATQLSEHYIGRTKHHFPTCFVCGPARAAGDGLRIFPGAENAGEPVAAPWVPHASLAEEDGVLPPEVVWAALDCVGYFAVAAPEYPVALLGRMTAELVAPVRVWERLVVMGFSQGRDGRKLNAGTAIFGSDGSVRGKARQTWICLNG